MAIAFAHKRYASLRIDYQPVAKRLSYSRYSGCQVTKGSQMPMFDETILGKV
jgi:hypothetical protein